MKAIQSIGTLLRQERRRKHVSLLEVAQFTRIPLPLLSRIEADQFDELPGEVFVRGYLRSYASFIGLEPRNILARYAGAPRPQQFSYVPSITVYQQTRSGRFGISVTLVVLFIFLAVSLSIVWAPRSAEGRMEVSDATPASTSSSVV